MSKIFAALLTTLVLIGASPAENSYSNAPTTLPVRKVAPPAKPKPRPLPQPITIFRFSESAFQELPRRVILAPQRDPLTQEMRIVPMSISGLLCRNAQTFDLDPLLLDILTRHESGYNPAAVSPVGARGLMQLMPETAASLGLTNPDDPAQNIYGGTRYLWEQWLRYGDLPLALAAYNAGPNSVEAYGGVPPFAETEHYVASITDEYLRTRRRR